MQSHTALTSVAQLVGMQLSGSGGGGGGGGVSGGGGRPPGGTQGALWGLQQISIAAASTHMMGKAPGTFEGDRTKAK